MRPLFTIGLAICLCSAIVAAHSAVSVLPNDWAIRDSAQFMTGTDTMPQGAAASPDGTTLAVIASGFNPPTLRLYEASDLTQVASFPLRGALGRPLWIDGQHILVSGANADALFDVDTARQSVEIITMPAHSYPTAISRHGGRFAVATDGDSSVRIGTLDSLASARSTLVGGHVGGLAFSSDGRTLFASNRADRYVVAIDTATLARRIIPTGLHPCDLLVVGSRLYVAESDNDSIGIYDAISGKELQSIFVGDTIAGARVYGVSPNALAWSGGQLYVSLGAANSIAVIRNGRVAGRLSAGWYPTDMVPIGSRLYIVDGKGETTQPNPYFKAGHKRSLYDYVASIQYGSIRVYNLARGFDGGNPQGAQSSQEPPQNTVIRALGPIKHVFFVLKENRSYDQVLGDIPKGNGDPKLVWFGAQVTPNEHALAGRFGLFDSAYASGEVSEPGHNWANAAFANDYLERSWPVIYGDRGNNDDTMTGTGAVVPKNGYIWQSAKAAHVSFRDYGELANTPMLTGPGVTTAPSLRGVYDPRYIGWNLDYSDINRIKEWRREFNAFLRTDSVPQLEWMWLPNDHTYGSRLGKLTPDAYVATNDYAVGLMVQAISHSSIWKSSAIFIIEDDAQDGADHVSDQRTTLFIVSPYAHGGLQHDHYSTLSVLRTIELILGLPALSAYDSTASPLYAAFSPTPDLRPYAAISPKVNITARNEKTAYGSALSAHMNFRRPDANQGLDMFDILAHNH